MDVPRVNGNLVPSSLYLQLLLFSLHLIISLYYKLTRAELHTSYMDLYDYLQSMLVGQLKLRAM